MGGPPRDPWSDPDTPTEEGAPYGGPPAWPPTAATPAGYPVPYGAGTYPAPYAGAPYPAPPVAPYGAPGYGPPGYGAPAYGAPGYGWPPPGPLGPRRPGQVVTAAVLAIVQAAIVAFASAYLLLFASVLGIDFDIDGAIDPEAAALADEARVLAWVQFASCVALVTAGVLALTRRDRGTWLALLGALGVQVLLALYWAIRIVGLLGDVRGSEDAVPVFVFGAVVFAASPAVGLGLLVSRAGREWFDPGRARG
ncbi:hypothetical protein [Trujillonella endophytica]|uniref:hypothetical protein n=1 Tax=Trujillonella endophytica TaxID=673521 RepID=UPI000B854845|nr:hypothetical protein [Trujillella endophytica]